MGLIIGVGDTKPTFPYDYWYGVEIDTSVTNPAITRIGRDELHRSLPLQSKMRRCIMKDNGTVNYYLNENDSTKRDTGSAANLTGADGMYMVELPCVYIKFEHDGTKQRVMMSEYPLPGFLKWDIDYISAVEATVYRPTNKLAAVCNSSADYRGGNNNADWDSLTKSLLGKPATQISLNNFRIYARNRGEGWQCMTYQTYKKLVWLFVVEYATLNTQAAFNAQVNTNGFRQGGLGPGVTTTTDAKWNAYNSYYPLIPCGVTNKLGNTTGVVSYTLPADFDTTTTVMSVPSYRGVENPFGHIWKWCDGIKILGQSEAAGGQHQFYVADNPNNWVNSGVAGYDMRGILPRSNGYVKEILFGNFGDILPALCGGGSTTYWCDYFYVTVPESGTTEYGVRFGGSAHYGSAAGFAYAYTSLAPTYTAAYLGSRLCFKRGAYT